MSINANEMALLLSELSFEDTFIQSVTEHDFKSLTFSLFSKQEKAWLLYFELGTSTSRFCKTDRMRKKAQKLQRLGQYLRANIVGSRIIEAYQIRGERVLVFKLKHHDKLFYIYFRFFSGPGANMIITDENNMILELMMRRPQRGEEKGVIYTPPEEKDFDIERFSVRSWEGTSFNSFIDKTLSLNSRDEKTQSLEDRVIQKRDKEISGLNIQLTQVEKRINETRGYESYKTTGDLLSSYSYLLKKGMDKVKLYDFEGNEATIILERNLSPSDNINNYYQKYKRAERVYENALSEADDLKNKIAERIDYYETILNLEDPVEKLKALEKAMTSSAPAGNTKETVGVGLRLSSHGFDILVGRNAKENDELLRHHVRGSDTWIHTRDFPGGYVFIRAKKDKSIPLEVLLDGANLAIHYSKAKNQGKADLYYTQVKYLRRAKDGKTGLVIPTQEKNLSVTMDEKRIKELLR
ncbi:MAG: NFACT RNA binding domain-containing protein [Sphaerochaetaceae bacterium]|nr:NFACT RNA binding domain-containing protein [Sphaerochaetaceae bacterium]